MSGLSETPVPAPEKPKERKTHTAESTGVRLNVTISKKNQASTQTVGRSTDVENYDLIQGHSFDEKLRALIPRGTSGISGSRGEKFQLRGSATRCTTSSSAPSSVLQGQERPTSCTWSPNFQDFRSGKLTPVSRPRSTICSEGTSVSEGKTG